MYLQVCLASGLDFFEDTPQFGKWVMSAHEKTVVIPVCSQTANLSWFLMSLSAKYGILNSGISFALLNCRRILHLLRSGYPSCEKWDGGAGKVHPCKPWPQARREPSVFWQSPFMGHTPCLLAYLSDPACLSHTCKSLPLLFYSWNKSSN